MLQPDGRSIGAIPDEFTFSILDNSLVYNPSLPALFSRNRFPSRMYRRSI